ncbi:MAG: UvrD-helicase domain-containing protein [Verrucomicrobia bacterium]|nr:UvrD-helicase domain-containing protein [Verrucomicrobiota bacterium]
MARLFDLNPEQQTAVKCTEGPLLVLAGAGTGKTRVITMRIAYLLHQGASAASILAVTFTNKAANEMRARVSQLVDKPDAKKLTLCTFHALCVRILRQEIERFGYKSNFTIYDEADQLALIRKIIARISATNEKLDPNLAKNLISRAKNEHWRIKEPAGESSLAAAVFHRYQEELKAANAVDFDDLLILTVRLFEEYVDTAEKWQNRYRYIMVDEFQDTNRLQLELVRYLGAKHQNVCVVGDDDQSIYGWRGAEVANILEFEHHFPKPAIVKLEQNYRSTASILGAANSIIRHNPRRRPKTLWSRNGEGEKVVVLEVPDDHEEANFVISEIQKRQQIGNLSWNRFAIVFRMNAQSRLLEENLRRLRIPYRLIGGRSFFERREVKDILAYLSCLANPNDDLNFLRIINTPARGIGNSTIELAVAESNQHQTSVYQTLLSPAFLDLLSSRTRTAVEKFAELLDRYETEVLQPLANLSVIAQKFLDEIDYPGELRRNCKTQEEAINREENVRELIRTLSDYQLRSNDGLIGFLAEMTLDQDRDDKNEDTPDGITLITFHAAKGLEFPHVFLIGLEEGILPHDRSKVDGQLDEERRLFYVGITRAMETLTVTHCATRTKYGSPSPCHPSSFLKDLDPAHVERINYHVIANQPASEGTARTHFAKMRELLGGM